MNLRDLLGDGQDRPPAPEVASPEDVERYNLEYLRSNGMEPRDRGGTAESITAKADGESLGDDVKSRAEFPWLYDPDRGVRWDFDPVQLRNLAQENTWVGMLVHSITKEVAETPWTITESDGAIETQKRLSTGPEQRDPISKDLPDATAERIYDLLMNPNPDHDWYDAVEMWLGDLLEVGSLSVTKAFPRQAYDGDEFTADPAAVKPRALQTSAPEVWTKDYHDKTGILDGFWQFENNSAPGTGDPDGHGIGTRGIHDPTFFDTAEVVWSDMTPRSNRRYGMPPTLLVADFLQSLDLAISQEQQYLSKGSMPSGAAVFENWDREELKEWKEENEENITGKPWKLLTVAGKEGGFSFEPFTYNFDEMQFTERQKWYARVVASAFQVPTAVVGIEPERVNYNTFQGERENFESNTLGPYLQKLERIINDQIIAPHWGRDSYRFEFKPGMSESTRGMISERVRSEFNANLRTRNEARREVGLEPVEDADDGFKEDVTEEPDGDGGPFGDVEGLEQAAAKANGVAVEFPNAGGPAFERRVTLIDFCDDLAEVCDGGVFVGEDQYPDELTGDGDGQPVRAVGINERKAYAVWSRYRDEAVALSDPHAIDGASEVAEQSAEKDTDEFAADVFRLVADGEHEMFDAGTVLGIGVDFPNSDVYVDWNIDEWPDDEQLSDAHVSIYATMDDAQKVAQGRIEPMDSLDAADAEAIARSVVEKADGGGSGNGSLRKDDPLRETDEWYQFDVQPAAVEALQEAIADDVSELYDRALDDAEIQAIIERMAAEDDDTGDGSEETAKSSTALARKLKDILAQTRIAGDIADAIREHSAEAVRETFEATIEDVDADADPDPEAVDIEAVTEQLADRDVAFADRFANDMAEDIRETVGDGWAEGKNSREIAEDLADQSDYSEGWGGAERVARQELQIATGEARSEVAAEMDKVEVWNTTGGSDGDGRNRDAHLLMHEKWKFPSDSFVVDYSDRGRGTKEESVPGNSAPGIGCRCTTLLRDRSEVDDDDYAGNGALS